MIEFMLVVAAMLLVALTFIIVPLVRTGRATAPELETLAVLADAIRELELERASGSLNPADYEASRSDLERQMVEADAASTERRAVDGRAAWSAALVAGIALPLVAVILYAGVGQPGALLGGTSQAMAGTERLDGAIVALSKRLENDGADGEGWVLLARSYLAANRAADALGAYRKATALIPDNPDLLVEYANTLAIANNRNLAGKPEELIVRALAIAPDNVNALALAGAAALQGGHRPQAVAHWTRLQSLLDPASDDGKRVSALIAMAKGEVPAPSGLQPGGTAATPGTAPPAGAMAAAPTLPGAAPHPGTMTAGQPGAAAATGAGIRGTVTVAGELAGKVAPSDTLFIFAKAANGPPMPVAVMRTRAGSLPIAFSLDDSSAMVEGMALSSFARVNIVARVSRLGNATSQPGDIEGHIDNVALGSTDVRVVMDRVVGR